MPQIFLSGSLGMVCKRYENKPMVKNSLFVDLFGIKRVKHPSSIRNLVLEIDDILQRLKSAGEESDR